MTNAAADVMVARVSRHPAPTPQKDAAALSAQRQRTKNAVEMGWIRLASLPPNRPICRPGAVLCRSFYFRPPPTRPVDGHCRTAAIGT